MRSVAMFDLGGRSLLLELQGFDLPPARIDALRRGDDFLDVGIGLAEMALDFALDVLAEGGGFVAKVFQGGSERAMLEQMKRRFASVRHAKPPASRKESSELYVVATGFRIASYRSWSSKSRLSILIIVRSFDWQYPRYFNTVTFVFKAIYAEACRIANGR